MSKEREEFDFLDDLLGDELKGSEDTIANKDDGQINEDKSIEDNEDKVGKETQDKIAEDSESDVKQEDSLPLPNPSLPNPPDEDSSVSSINSEIIDDNFESDSEFVSVDETSDLEDEYDYEDYLDEDDELAGLPPSFRAALEWEPQAPRSTKENVINEWITSGWVGDLHVDKILTEAIITGASDVHITADLRVSMTRDGDIIRYDGYPIPDEEIMHKVIHEGILTHQQQAILNNEFEYEGAYTINFGPMAGRRTRLTLGRTFGKYFMVFRIISEYIPGLEELGVEQEIVEWSKFPNGLFLLCGPTGSGKSTTLASVIHNLQMTTQKKIISIEKPIEYIYPDEAPSLVVQREVGEDTRGFYEGLTSAMRQSPNVILLGEVRNTEEVTELLRAAETGHLAISTMHTNSVATTINRIQNLFSGNEQKRIMSTLTDTMRGIGNQVLVKNIDGDGRFAVRELLTINDEIKELILEGDVRGIREYQVRNKATMEHKLAAAVMEEKCHYKDALDQTADPILFNRLIDEGYN